MGIGLKYHELVINAINELDFFFKLDEEEKSRAYKYAERVGWVMARPSTIAIVVLKLSKPKLQFCEIRKFCNTNVQTLKPWIVKCGRKLKIAQPMIRAILEEDGINNNNTKV